jgi:hypothetical protein
MSEIEKYHPTQIERYEFEPGLTESEQIAVVCAYVIDALNPERGAEETQEMRASLEDIAACETTDEALGAMPMLVDFTEGDYDILFDALVVAGVVEGVRSGNEEPQQQEAQNRRARSVLLGKNLLQLPASS